MQTADGNWKLQHCSLQITADQSWQLQMHTTAESTTADHWKIEKKYSPNDRFLIKIFIKNHQFW